MPTCHTTLWHRAWSTLCCCTLSTHGPTVRRKSSPRLSPIRPPPHAASRAAGGLYEGKLLDEAIRRYECIWLPLLRSKHKYNGSKVDMTPPLDVAYVWHVHRLDPNYANFCKQAFGHVFVPERPFAFSTTPPSGWDRTEPFYPPRLNRNHTAAWCELHGPKAPAYLMPRLAEAVKRQASFGHMFLRLCYQDRTYLELVRPGAPSLTSPRVSTGRNVVQC
jgi:hypothetical protein